MAYQVVVIGAGFGGIGMAIALQRAGLEDFVVLDRADDLGGTWRDNSYPGLTCDIPSQLYSFSFRSWRWSRRFPARAGFRATQFLTPMQVSGRGGGQLHEAWRDGAQAYLGITVAGFPNFFMLYGPNTNLGGNSIIYMLEGQIGYVLGAIQALNEHGLAWLDVRPDVQDAFNSWVQSASRTSVWESGCHSWYTTASGRNTNNWPDHTFLYRYRVRRFDLAAYRIMPAHAAPPAPGAVPA